MEDLIADFVAECREMLEALGGEIVAWEAQPDDRSRLDLLPIGPRLLLTPRPNRVPPTREGERGAAKAEQGVPDRYSRQHQERR